MAKKAFIHHLPPPHLMGYYIVLLSTNSKF
jgi:hypothetical protein